MAIDYSIQSTSADVADFSHHTSCYAGNGVHCIMSHDIYGSPRRYKITPVKYDITTDTYIVGTSVLFADSYPWGISVVPTICYDPVNEVVLAVGQMANVLNHHILLRAFTVDSDLVITLGTVVDIAVITGSGSEVPTLDSVFVDDEGKIAVAHALDLSSSSTSRIMMVDVSDIDSLAYTSTIISGVADGLLVSTDGTDIVVTSNTSGDIKALEGTFSGGVLSLAAPQTLVTGVGGVLSEHYTKNLEYHADEDKYCFFCITTSHITYCSVISISGGTFSIGTALQISASAYFHTGVAYSPTENILFAAKTINTSAIELISIEVSGMGASIADSTITGLTGSSSAAHLSMTYDDYYSVNVLYWHKPSTSTAYECLIGVPTVPGVAFWTHHKGHYELQ